MISKLIFLFMKQSSEAIWASTNCQSTELCQQLPSLADSTPC